MLRFSGWASQFSRALSPSALKLACIISPMSQRICCFFMDFCIRRWTHPWELFRWECRLSRHVLCAPLLHRVLIDLVWGADHWDSKYKDYRWSSRKLCRLALRASGVSTMIFVVSKYFFLFCIQVGSWEHEKFANAFMQILSLLKDVRLGVTNCAVGWTSGCALGERSQQCSYLKDIWLSALFTKKVNEIQFGTGISRRVVKDISYYTYTQNTLLCVWQSITKVLRVIL